MSDLKLDGMALADGVVETIVAIALQDVEGVSLSGAANPAGILGSIASSKPGTQGIEVRVGEGNTIEADVHITVSYGFALPELAAKVRSVVSDAVLAQVGVDVSAVNVYIDGIQF